MDKYTPWPGTSRTTASGARYADAADSLCRGRGDFVEGQAVMSSYAATAQEIMAMPKPDTRHADRVRRSDVLLHRLEKLNLDAYRPYRPEQPPVGGVRKVVAVPAELAQAVNQLRMEVGLEPRRLRTTSEALEAVWAAQRRLFGQPDQEEGEEEEEEEQS